METSQIQSIVVAFQKLMQQKGFSAKTQWDELTIMPTKVLSKSTFLQRLSSYGLDLTDDEVSLLWNHYNMKPDSINFNDFEKIMKTTFHIPQANELPISVTLNDHGRSRQVTAPTQRYISQASYQDEQPYDSNYQRSINPQGSPRGMSRRAKDYDSDDEGGHSYYTCKTIKERELTSLPLSDMKTIDSLSNTSIQRQQYDGPSSTRRTFKSKTSLKKTMATISDIACSVDPSSWSCFLRWRDPTKNTIDAQDLASAIQRDANVRLNLADVQKVIDKYGPLNQNTFKLMLTEGHRYSMSGNFDDDDGC